jgi:hypothetical protein
MNWGNGIARDIICTTPELLEIRIEWITYGICFAPLNQGRIA